MATGDLTVTTTEYATMALLNAAYTAENSGAATAGADTTTFHITVDAKQGMFYLTKVVRAA